MIFIMIYLVDNVHVREAPTCPSPLVSNFGVANLTSNSAELTWLSGVMKHFGELNGVFLDFL